MARDRAAATQQTGGIPRVDDRRVLNGIFRVLRSGAPWRDLPERAGPAGRVRPRLDFSVSALAAEFRICATEALKCTALVLAL
jgi:transposase